MHDTDNIQILTSVGISCTVNKGGCQQTCTESSGTVTCSCKAGYQLLGDSVSCGGRSALFIHMYMYIFSSIYERNTS